MGSYFLKLRFNVNLVLFTKFILNYNKTIF
jgi:hypothetical protein